jgi:hypothetical protein
MIRWILRVAKRRTFAALLRAAASQDIKRWRKLELRYRSLSEWLQFFSRTS